MPASLKGVLSRFQLMQGIEGNRRSTIRFTCGTNSADGDVIAGLAARVSANLNPGTSLKGDQGNSNMRPLSDKPDAGMSSKLSSFHGDTRALDLVRGPCSRFIYSRVSYHQTLACRSSTHFGLRDTGAPATNVTNIVTAPPNVISARLEAAVLRNFITVELVHEPAL